jgi:Subtilase family
MRRLLILILILLVLFSLFFYFSLGTEPKSFVEEKTENLPLTTQLDTLMQRDSSYKAFYVYIKGAGYVLRNRKIVLLVGKDSAQERQAEAIKNIEKELESYWKWQIMIGKKSIEEIAGRNRESINPKKGFFNRIFDVFKVADAINVVRDNAKTCNCDDDLLLLSGPDLHLISTTLNPDGGGVAMGPPNGSLAEKSYIDPTQFLKSAPQEPQTGDGNSSFLVGIIDSGINFGGNIKQSKSYRTVNYEPFISAKIEPSLNYNFMRNNTEVIDSVNHGTKIARIIVKNTSSERIKLVALKTFDRNKIGNLYDNLCAIIYAIKHNMKIVNASWGASIKEPIAVFDEVLRRAKSANMVVVCSAGNEKKDIDVNPYYPACYADHSELGSYVISVTSKNDSVCQNRSSSGKKIDLTVKTDYNCKHAIPDNMGNIGKVSDPGTSYAAPYVTAGVINYMFLHPSGFSKSGYLGSISAGGDINKY